MNHTVFYPLMRLATSLVLLLALASCVRMQVGDNIRSTGWPNEVANLRLSPEQPVYTKAGSYYVQVPVLIHYTHPPSFNPDTVFLLESRYSRYQDTGKLVWLQLKKSGTYPKVIPCDAPDLATCRLVPHQELPSKWQDWSKSVHLKELPNPQVSTGQNIAAAPFDYFIDPVGTVVINIPFAVGIGVAYFVAAPIKFVQQCSPEHESHVEESPVP